MRVLPWLGLISTLGCTEVYVREGRIEGLRELARKARQQGAYRCAPEELALAEASIDFAATDLAQGDLDRAEDHLILGEANARAAVDLSPPEQCEFARAGDRDGDGIPDDTDRCAEQPEDLDSVEDGDGCPEDQDTDGDGISDALDLCVASAEDKDGQLDGDGCPEEDNDADRLLDAADSCPNDAEDPDGFNDDDGCPDLDNDGDGIEDAVDACPNEHGLAETRGCPKVYKDVLVTDRAVVITQQVHFETNKATIKPDSYALLDTVATALRDFPAIRVEVQGHTDDRGPDRRNLQLSRDRAESVRAYLIARGIEPFRMSAEGYGEARPIESNRSEIGRAANRRVEFVRTDESAGKAPATKVEGGAPVDPEAGAP